MNVQTMTIPKDQAREKLRWVRKQLHRRADAEYQALEAAYEQSARGRPIVDVKSAIFAAPRDAAGRPRLAIARADKLQARFDGYSNGRWTFTAMPTSRRGPGPWMGNITFQSDDPSHRLNWVQGFALVPMIPAEHRGVHDLTRHHILWEVEQWSNTSLLATPDRDPYLLKHIAGDLFAVLAEWDLTDIERAVMAGRAQDVR